MPVPCHPGGLCEPPVALPGHRVPPHEHGVLEHVKDILLEQNVDTPRIAFAAIPTRWRRFLWPRWQGGGGGAGDGGAGGAAGGCGGGGAGGHCGMHVHTNHARKAERPGRPRRSVSSQWTQSQTSTPLLPISTAPFPYFYSPFSIFLQPLPSPLAVVHSRCAAFPRACCGIGDLGTW